MRYGTEVLGAQEGFFSKLVDVVGDHMGAFFPELLSAKETIRSVLVEEETSFGRTLKKVRVDPAPPCPPAPAPLSLSPCCIAQAG